MQRFKSFCKLQKVYNVFNSFSVKITLTLILHQLFIIVNGTRVAEHRHVGSGDKLLPCRRERCLSESTTPNYSGEWH